MRASITPISRFSQRDASVSTCDYLLPFNFSRGNSRGVPRGNFNKILRAPLRFSALR